MTYIFDTSPLSTLFRNYYRDRFPTLWLLFETAVAGDRIVSTREVLREIEDGPVPSLTEWVKHKKHVFATPTAEEGVFVSKIFQIPHFRQNIEQRKLLKGGRNADPFVIARAHAIGGVVVTMERRKPNSAGIPAIGDHFAIKCVSLEEFMELKKWQF